MKVIEGTPEEIIRYQNLKVEKENPPVIPRLTGSYRENLLEHGVHWSSSKHTWVDIKDMNTSYILNVIKKKIREQSNEELITSDREFASLVLVLGEKLLSE